METVVQLIVSSVAICMQTQVNIFDETEPGGVKFGTWHGKRTP